MTDTGLLLLDAGGVLVHPNWARVGEALRRHGAAVEDSALIAAEPVAKLELDRPVCDSTDASRGEDYYHRVVRHAGVERSPATEAALLELREHHDRHNLWEHVPDAVRGFLSRLQAGGVRLVLVSNANGTVREHFGRLGLARFFHTMIDSHEEGCEKPDPRLFQIALERAGSRTDPVAHLGDLFHVDVVGARAAGIDGWLYDPHDMHADKDCRRFSTLDQVLAAVLD